MGTSSAELLRQIETDNTSGAAQLATLALKGFFALADELSDDDTLAWGEVITYANRVMCARPSMASIGVQGLRIIKQMGEWSGVLDREKLKAAATHLLNAREGIFGKIVDCVRARQPKGGTLISCSWSSTVSPVLEALCPEKVILGHGHGLLDGIKSAQWLSSRGIDVTVVSDGALPACVEGATAVYVGADQVLANGDLVNRCGTFPLALAASYFKVPFWVVCDSSKFAGLERAELETDNRNALPLPVQVSGKWPLFDITPHSTISGYYTDEGCLYPSDVQSIGAQMIALRRSLSESFGLEEYTS